MKILIIAALMIGFQAQAANDFLIKLKPEAHKNLSSMHIFSSANVVTEKIESIPWVRVTFKNQTQRQIDNALRALNQNPDVLAIQKNGKIKLLEDYIVRDPVLRKKIENVMAGPTDQPKDNPEIPDAGPVGSGADPLFGSQWGMFDIGVKEAWKVTMGIPSITVAVIDTGIDYTHEDLRYNLWRNKGETGTDSSGQDKATNGIDDDGNGYIDDTVGWDFVSNDNRPFDLTVPVTQLLLGGGNPGHGTHCSGNVGARGTNGVGIAGVAPKVTIMGLRFLSEKGEGTTAEGIKAIEYAVKNGARVLSNSWGSEGEDPNDNENNQALRDIIQFAQDHDVLFVAAAGNGHQGVGYDNDSDAKPGYPASYDNENIVSVAALNSQDQMGSFSNWGKNTVDIGAPGVKVFSTVPGGYQDTIFDMFGLTVTWDGTSMATPHVAGAAALYLSKHPKAGWQEVKDALLESAQQIPALNGKVVSDGKLNVESLLKK